MEQQIRFLFLRKFLHPKPGKIFGLIIPHPLYSFAVTPSSFQCLNDVEIGNPKGGSLRLGMKETLYTFRFVE